MRGAAASADFRVARLRASGGLPGRAPAGRCGRPSEVSPQAWRPTVPAWPFTRKLALGSSRGRSARREQRAVCAERRGAGNVRLFALVPTKELKSSILETEIGSFCRKKSDLAALDPDSRVSPTT